MLKARKITTDFLITFITLLLCISAQLYTQFPVVLALCFIVLLGTLIFKSKSHRSLIYIAAFCSMGAFFHDSQFFLHSFILTAIVLLLTQITRQLFHGHGGKLGSIAFIATISYYLVLQLIQFIEVGNA